MTKKGRFKTFYETIKAEMLNLVSVRQEIGIFAFCQGGRYI